LGRQPEILCGILIEQALREKGFKVSHLKCYHTRQF
jgi:hypothetical protein